MMKQKDNLIRKFSLYSIVIIVLLGVVLNLVISYKIENMVMERTKYTTASIVETNARYHHLTGLMKDNENDLRYILENAVKFCKAGGGVIKIIALKKGNMAQFSISDNGIGIKEENIEKLFQVFQQLDSGISRRYQGTGLGLSASKKLVELHGGKIWAESKYGEGSTFTFQIPIESQLPPPKGRGHVP